ncbi:hypothetical protein HN51_065060 [Arachis hypogaea]
MKLSKEHGDKEHKHKRKNCSMTIMIRERISRRGRGCNSLNYFGDWGCIIMMIRILGKNVKACMEGESVVDECYRPLFAEEEGGDGSDAFGPGGDKFGEEVEDGELGVEGSEKWGPLTTECDGDVSQRRRPDAAVRLKCASTCTRKVVDG